MRGKFFFTYSVRIEYVGASDAFRAQLTTRHWEITDSTGSVDRVDGPGVIGLYPVVYRGCPPFTYQSVCPLPTPTGSMRGSFQFRVESDRSTFDAVVAPFTFDTRCDVIC